MIRERKIVIFITSSPRYCSNDCDHMSVDAKRCQLFDKALDWDPFKTEHGNKRLLECLRAEHSVKIMEGR